MVELVNWSHWFLFLLTVLRLHPVTGTVSIGTALKNNTLL